MVVVVEVVVVVIVVGVVVVELVPASKLLPIPSQLHALKKSCQILLFNMSDVSRTATTPPATHTIASTMVPVRTLVKVEMPDPPTRLRLYQDCCCHNERMEKTRSLAYVVTMKSDRLTQDRHEYFEL